MFVLKTNFRVTSTAEWAIMLADLDLEPGSVFPTHSVLVTILLQRQASIACHPTAFCLIHPVDILFEGEVPGFSCFLLGAGVSEGEYSDVGAYCDVGVS
jgi:hypothetical protein